MDIQSLIDDLVKLNMTAPDYPVNLKLMMEAIRHITLVILGYGKRNTIYS